jgi:iron complex transport system substrate-binding protein
MNVFLQRTTTVSAVLLVLALSLGGCASISTVSPPTASPGTASLTYTATDYSGMSIRLGKAPQRIVSLGPSATEILYSLGALDRLVAVTTADDYPPEVSKMDTVGGTDNPSLEKIMALQPDLVFAVFGNPQTLVDNLIKQGITVFQLNPQTVADVLSDIRKVGELIGNTDQAARQVASIQKTMAELKQKLDTSTGTLPTVYLETWPQEPYYTYGPGTFGNDLIEMAGGRNIGAETDSAYPALSTEYIFFEDPDAIVLAYITQTASGSSPKERKGWEQLQAVIRNNILQVKDPNIYLRPGPRIGQALEELAHFLHPEWFK